jgi:hypothetical protein
LAAYDRTEAEDSNVFAALRKLFCSYGDFPCARYPDHRYLFVGGAMPFETIYGAGKQLSGYKFVEPADYNSVIAFSGCQPTFYFFNHSFASPNNILNLKELKLPPLRVATHYKTNIGWFPEKDRLRLCRATGPIHSY